MIDLFPPVFGLQEFGLNDEPHDWDFPQRRRRSGSSFTNFSYADGTKWSGRITSKDTHIWSGCLLKKTKAGELSHVSWLKIKTKLGRFYIFNVCFKDFYSGWPVTSLQCFTGKQLHAFVQKQDRKTFFARGFKLQGEIGSNLIATKPPRSS